MEVSKALYDVLSLYKLRLMINRITIWIIRLFNSIFVLINYKIGIDK